MGKFDASRDAELVEETIDLEAVPAGNIVVEVQSLSIDAFIRTMVSSFGKQMLIEMRRK